MTQLAASIAAQGEPAEIRRGAVGRALLFGLALMLPVAGLLFAAGKPGIAACWLALCLIDLKPIAAAGIFRTTQSFTFVWVGAALVRMPVGLLLANWVRSDSQAVAALPFVYLASLLLSGALAAMIIGQSQAVRDSQVRG